jgi:hypothetical protein
MDYPFYTHDIGTLPRPLFEALVEEVTRPATRWNGNRIFVDATIRNIPDGHKSPRLQALTLEVRDQLTEWLPSSAFLGGNFNLLAANSFLPEHSDINAEFVTCPMNFVLQHKVHIPLKTSSLVTNAHRRSRHQEQVLAILEAGHCYLYNDYVWHSVVNGSSEDRIHMIMKYSDPDWSIRCQILERLGQHFNHYEN